MITSRQTEAERGRGARKVAPMLGCCDAAWLGRAGSPPGDPRGGSGPSSARTENSLAFAGEPPGGRNRARYGLAFSEKPNGIGSGADGAPTMRAAMTPPNADKKYLAEVLTTAEVAAVIGQCSAKAPTGIRNQAPLTLRLAIASRRTSVSSRYLRSRKPAADRYGQAACAGGCFCGQG